MDQNVRFQGTVINWKTALKNGAQKITGGKQMDGVSSKKDEICKRISVGELEARVLEEKTINKWCLQELKQQLEIMSHGRSVLRELD